MIKRFAVIFLLLLSALAFPLFAFADVAGLGTVIVFGLLPYVLIAAVVVVALVLLVKCIRKNRKKTDGVQDEGKRE